MNAIEIAKAAVAVAEKFYSEDQERDANGRWGGGGSSGKAAEKAGTAKEHAAAASYHLGRVQAHEAHHEPKGAAVHAAAQAAHVRAEMALRQAADPKARPNEKLGPSTLTRMSGEARAASRNANASNKEGRTNIPKSLTEPPAKIPGATWVSGKGYVKDIPKSLTEKPTAPGMKWIPGKGFVTKKGFATDIADVLKQAFSK